MFPADYERSKTRFLSLLRRQDPSAEEFACAVYEELYRLARKHRLPRSITPSDLVQEAFPKLFRSDGQPWQDRQHYYAIATRAMHCILVDRARARARKRRDPGRAIVEFDDSIVLEIGTHPVKLLHLDDVLEQLHSSDPAMYRALLLRLYSKMSLPEIAETVAVPMRTFERRWRVLEGWLWESLGLGKSAEG